MGIDTGHRKGVRDNIAPDAFSITLSRAIREVIIEDYLIRMKADCGYEGQLLLDGDALFDMFWQRISRELLKEDVFAWIVCIDDKENVVRKGIKTETHKKRKQQQAIQIKRNNDKVKEQQEKQKQRILLNNGETKEPEPPAVVVLEDVSDQNYPIGYRLTDDGIMYPSADGQTIITEPQFDLRRVMGTGNDRTELWRYLNARLQSQTITDGKVLIFESSAEGPWFHSGDEHVHRTDLAHDHGEFDTSVQFWMWFFEQYPVRIVTTDTDMIPLVMSHLMQTKESSWNPHIQWVYMNQEHKALERFGVIKSDIYVVDMIKYYRMTPRNLGFTPQQYLFAVILAGTDHFDRHDVFDGFAWRHIFEGVRLMGLSAPEDGYTIKEMIPLLYRFMMQIYTAEIGTAKLNSMIKKKEWTGKPIICTDERYVVYFDREQAQNVAYLEEDDFELKQKSSKRLRVEFPGPEQIDKAAKDIAFNLRYWHVDWKKHTQDESLIRIKKEMKDKWNTVINHIQPVVEERQFFMNKRKNMPTASLEEMNNKRGRIEDPPPLEVEEYVVVAGALEEEEEYEIV